MGREGGVVSGDGSVSGPFWPQADSSSAQVADAHSAKLVFSKPLNIDGF
jgi:hypothetical protein